jgi:hypothetical protein
MLAAVTGSAVNSDACTAPPPPQQDAHHQRASSYAPRPKSPNHAYGMPIQPTILHHRVKKPKKPAEAVSVPAQDLPSAPAAGG